MTPCFLTQLIVICAVVCAHSSEGKGSDSHKSSYEEASDTEDSSEHEKQKRKTGAQNKFWVPTYPGTNPLNRRKIELTNSEIERFDSSIDESISGVIKNGTRIPKKNHLPEKDLSRLPYAWSGENISNNITVKDLPSLDSSLVTVESERSQDEGSTEFKKNYSPFIWNKKNKSDSTDESSDQSENLSSTSSHTSSEESSTSDENTKGKEEIAVKKPIDRSEHFSRKKKSRTKFVTTNKTATVKHSKVEQTPQETTKLIKNPKEKLKDPKRKPETAKNETILSKEYYRKMVEAALENTKSKLGYRELSQVVEQTFRPIVPDSLAIDGKSSAPEIYKVNMDKISRDSVKSEEEIHFQTKHDQLLPKASKSDTEKYKDGGKKERVKKLAHKLVGDPKEGKIHWNLTQSELDKIYKKQREEDFPSSVYYDAWSDVLLKNRTQRKSKQRKPKTVKLSSSYERSSGDMRAWPGKNIREKADELRKKEGKSRRKDKRKKDQKNKMKRQKDKKESGKRNAGENYSNVYQDPPEVGKKQVGKKVDEYDYKGDSLDYDSRLRGKGEGGKNYDYSYNEYSDSLKNDRKKPLKKAYKKDYNSDKPKRKFRMTTEGEKRYAYKEVKSYLNEMDKEYGGRPGGDTYREKRGRGYERGSGRGRGWDKRDDGRGRFRTEGGERGRFDRWREGKGSWGGRGRGRGTGRDDWDDRDRRGREQRGRGSGWGRDDRVKGRDRRGNGRDDRWNSRGGGRRDGRGRGGGRGGGRGRGRRGGGGRS